MLAGCLGHGQQLPVLLDHRPLIERVYQLSLDRLEREGRQIQLLVEQERGLGHLQEADFHLVQIRELSVELLHHWVHYLSYFGDDLSSVQMVFLCLEQALVALVPFLLQQDLVVQQGARALWGACIELELGRGRVRAVVAEQIYSLGEIQIISLEQGAAGAGEPLRLGVIRVVVQRGTVGILVRCVRLLSVDVTINFMGTVGAAVRGPLDVEVIIVERFPIQVEMAFFRLASLIYRDNSMVVKRIPLKSNILCLRYECYLWLD